MEINEGVKWAADYVIKMAGSAGERIETETKVEYMREGKPVTFGYLDAYFKGNLFDLKTGRERAYVLQMCVYAAALCQRDNLEAVKVYLLYSETKSATHAIVRREVAENLVEDVISRVEDSAKQPAQCDYCNWCERKRVCHAVNPDRNLRALSRACERNLSPLVDSFAKSMRIKDRNDAEQYLRGLLADLTISGK